MVDLKECHPIDTRIPVSITQQVQDGCVTASARAIIPCLGVDFERDFLPRLQKYSLDPINPENNHMLGVAAVATDMGLNVLVHTRNPLKGDVIPDDVPARVRAVHTQVIDELVERGERGVAELQNGEIDQEGLASLLGSQLNHGRYALVFLDWAKWNAEAQAKFKNPRHIIAVYEINGDMISAIDPSLNPRNNPVRATNSCTAFWRAQ